MTPNLILLKKRLRLYWLPAPDRLYLEIRVVLARTDLPSQLSDIHQDLLPAPADNDIGDEEYVALDVRFESSLRPVPYLLQLLVAGPAADRSL
jgi:hypothetical protein